MRPRPLPDAVIKVLDGFIEWMCPTQSGKDIRVSRSTPNHLASAVRMECIEMELEAPSYGFIYNYLQDYNISWKHPFFFCPYCFDLAELKDQIVPLSEKQQQRYQVCLILHLLN